MENQILDAPTKQANLNYAGFWIRFVAYLVDGIILWIVQMAIGFTVISDYSMLEGNVTLSIISLFIGIAYFSGMESSTRQATVGKILLGLKVGNASGQQISFANALGRYLAKIPSALILLIGFMMAGWDAKKQALHDKLANTYVFQG